jgi:putative intracellular protease/amidase
MSANANVTNPARRKRVLLIAANAATSPVTDWPVGFWWAELTHPWWAFTEAGYEVEIRSPQGGALVADSFSDPEDASGYSAHDILSLGFKHSPTHAALLADTKSIADVRVDDDDAVFVTGRTWTGFADAEEQFADDFVGLRSQPFWIETEARQLAGTNFVVDQRFREFAVRDGHLITGQQQFSGAAAARLLIEALGR